jgi:uncharacterized membrane protein YphA (DoxX/SURF4 family)
MYEAGPKAAGPSESSESVESGNVPERWRPSTRVGFRFVFSYLFLVGLSFASEMIAFASYDLQSKVKWPPPIWPPWTDQAFNFTGCVQWVGRHIFHLQKPVQFLVGYDTMFDYLKLFCLLLLALLCAAAWTVMDRKRLHYRRLLEWLTLFLQVVLAGEMFSYGFEKIFPNQFGSLSKLEMLQPVGDLSRMDLLWRFMAASRGYTIFGGLMEILGGILLLIPRFRRIGALVCVAVMVNVFALNLSYDVSVKLVSCNLLLLAIFLAVPEFPRLVRLLVFNSAAPPVRSTLLSERRWIDRSARILQIILGIALFFVFLYGEADNIPNRKRNWLSRCHFRVYGWRTKSKYRETPNVDFSRRRPLGRCTWRRATIVGPDLYLSARTNSSSRA